MFFAERNQGLQGGAVREGELYVVEQTRGQSLFDEVDRIVPPEGGPDRIRFGFYDLLYERREILFHQLGPQFANNLGVGLKLLEL